MRIKKPESLLKLVSPRVGIIRHLQRVTRGAEEPNPPVIYHAQLSHFDFRKASTLERGATGKGETDEEAMTGAIGEAIERYCGYHPDHSRFVQKSFGELYGKSKTGAIPPPEFVLYSERQYSQPGFRYQRFESQQPLNWIKGWTLPDRREILLPASLVYLNYFGEDHCEIFCPPTSSGMAAGPDLDWAILNGLYEMVERDAFLLTWMNRLPASRIDCSQLGGLAQLIIRHYLRSGIEVHVFFLATDIPIPVMMAIAVDRSGRGPAAVVGLGCHLNPIVAIRKALLEVCQVRPGETARLAENRSEQRVNDYRQIRSLEDHSAYFATPERLAEFSFLLDNPLTKSCEEITDFSSGCNKDDLATVLSLLEQAGCQAAFVELTTADVVEFDVRVVRTLVTRLQPIHFGYGEERLGGKRLFEVAEAMGYDNRIRTEEDLNPCPHPLA